MTERVVKQAQSANEADGHGGADYRVSPAANHRRLSILLVTVALFALLQWRLRPLTIWEYDEALYLSAIESHEPLLHHPPPPGCPVLVGTGQLVNLVVDDPFVTLRGIGIVASVLGFLLLVLTLEALSLTTGAAVAGAALFYLSPVMLVHSTLPLTDPGALALLIGAAWASLRATESTRRAALFAVLAALGVGWRLQQSIFVLPLLAAVLLRVRRPKPVLVILAFFTVVCLGWLVPLIVAAGGLQSWYGWVTGQAGYFVQHDAAISRSGWPFLRTMFRFTAHAWGAKWLSFPVLFAACAGLLLVVRRRTYAMLPLLLAAAVYLSLGLAMMDPADGARYSLPSTLVVGLLAAVAFGALPPLVRFVPVVLFAVGSVYYVKPILLARTTTASPPAAVAAIARAQVPRDATILYELPLRPQAEWLLREWKTAPVDAAFRGPVPAGGLWLFANGPSDLPGAISRSWPWSDAYDKITRSLYLTVSLRRIDREERFSGVSGVYALERDRSGEEWRWLDAHAALDVPDLDRDAAVLTLALPPESPIETNDVVARFGGREVTTTVVKGAESIVLLPLEGEGGRLEIRAVRSFVPADIPGSLNHDPRRLAVQLRELRQVSKR